MRIGVSFIGCHILRSRISHFAFVLPVVSSLAWGQVGQIEEVIVTAQKRVENQQNVPIAITNLSSFTLENEGIYDFIDLAETVPSLSRAVYPSSGILMLYMRGQGVEDPMQIGADGSIGMYVDGHYISRPQGIMFDIADTERVEILRGPQGTLYGRNTTGGAINIITRKPSGKFAFKQNISVGSRNYVRSLSVLDLPEAGGVSTKISFLRKKQDGYVENIKESHDFGEVDETAGRVVVHWDVMNSLSVDYALDTGVHDSTPSYYQSRVAPLPINMPNPAYTHYRPATHPTNKSYRPVDKLKLSRTRFEGHGLTVGWDANEHLQLKSLSGYRELHYSAYQDYAEAFGMPMWVHDNVTDYQFTQDFQLIGDLGDSISFVSGLYYLKESSGHKQYMETDLTGFYGFVQEKNRDVKVTTKSQAVYGQVTWVPNAFDRKLDITVGARLTKDKKTGYRDTLITGVTPVFSFPLGMESHVGRTKTFRQFNPALTVSYSLSDQVNTYAKVVTGYKAGGFSESAQLGEFQRTFDPEEVTMWELGLKADLFDRQVRFNTAIYHSKFKDRQLFFVADAADTSVVQGYNAGKASVSGVEVDVTYVVTPDLQFQIDYAYMRQSLDRVDVLAGTIFDPAVNPMSPHQMGANIKDFFVVPYVPRNSLYVSGNYRIGEVFGGALSLNMNYRFQSSYYVSSPAGPRVPGRQYYRLNSYGTLNGRLALDFALANGHNLQLALWGKNITNKEYRLFMTGLGGGGAVATPLSPLGYTHEATSWAEPPSYGLEVIFDY